MTTTELFENIKNMNYDSYRHGQRYISFLAIYERHAMYFSHISVLAEILSFQAHLSGFKHVYINGLIDDGSPPIGLYLP